MDKRQGRIYQFVVNFFAEEHASVTYFWLKLRVTAVIFDMLNVLPFWTGKKDVIGFFNQRDEIFTHFRGFVHICATKYQRSKLQ